jgi:hypothetical protein
MNQAINAAAHQLAELEGTAAAANDALAAAHQHADDLRGRRMALTAERDAIAAARRAGQPVDSGRLALIDLDIAGLDDLLSAAMAAVAEAQGRADETRTAAANALEQLELVKSRELLAQLGHHATALAQKLHAAMAEIKDVETRLKLGRISWAPPKDFATDLRRLDLLADGIPGIR